MDDPRLPSQLGGPPARGRRDVGERERQHQHPEHGACRRQPSPPEEQRRDPHHQDEERPEPDHDVVAVIKELDVLRPLVLREVVQPLDGAAERAVAQEAEDPGHDDRVLQLALGDVRLSDDRELGVRSPFEQPLHRGEGHRLMPCHHLPGAVPGRERDQHAGGQPRDDPHAQADPGVPGVLTHQRPVSPHGGHHERRRDERGRHVVGVLPERPGIEDVRPETLEV